MAFGKEIKRLREDVPISVQKIANRIGVKPERWRKWEEKDLTPRLEDAQLIEKFFGKTLQEIALMSTIKDFLKVPHGTFKKKIGNNDHLPEDEADLKKVLVQLLRVQIEVMEKQNDLISGSNDKVHEKIDAVSTKMQDLSLNLTKHIDGLALRSHNDLEVILESLSRIEKGNPNLLREANKKLKGKVLKVHKKGSAAAKGSLSNR